MSCGTINQYLLIPVFAKLVERLMYNKIIYFLYENKIFTEAQHGFRKGICIETAVQSFIEMFQETIDKLVYTNGIFINLTKTYDVLNHKLFLEKLFCYGIRGSTNSWFRSYLTNGSQFIEINQSDSSSVTVNRYGSSSTEIKQSVPQGLALGPLLFLLCVYIYMYVCIYLLSILQFHTRHTPPDIELVA